MLITVLYYMKRVEVGRLKREVDSMSVSKACWLETGEEGYCIYNGPWFHTKGWVFTPLAMRFNTLLLLHIKLSFP